MRTPMKPNFQLSEELISKYFNAEHAYYNLGCLPAVEAARRAQVVVGNSRLRRFAPFGFLIGRSTTRQQLCIKASC